MKAVPTTVARLLLLSALVTTLFLGMTQRAYAAIIVVDDNCTLAEAIITANMDSLTDACSGAGVVTPPPVPGGIDTITLPLGATYTYDQAWGDPLGLGNAALPPITSALTINGNGATLQRDPSLSCPATNANEDFRFFTVELGGGSITPPPVTFIDLTLTNGCANGADSDSKSGGAILSTAGQIQLIESHLVGNFALGNGGAVASTHLTSTVNLFDSQILSNTSQGDGGGVYVTGNAPPNGPNLLVTNSGIAGNHSQGNGGGLYLLNGADGGPISIFQLLNSTVTSNTSQLDGGGVYIESKDLAVGGLVSMFSNSTVSDNSSQQAGGGV